VRENVIIAYRGASYELGQWPEGYGIWSAETEQSRPDQSWPATPDGWSAAWHRFVALEAANTIVPVAAQPTQQQPAQQQPAQDTVTLQPFVQPTAAPQQDTWIAARQNAATTWSASPRATWRPVVHPYLAAGLLAAGVACGLIGLFPDYQGGQSLASQAATLVPHVMYLAAWAVSAVLIVSGGIRRPAGALLGIGTSAVTLGLLFADAGFTIAGTAAGPGLVLTLIGWLACAGGSVLALGRGPRTWPRTLRGAEIGLAAFLIIAALGAAIAFAPAWDRYTLRTATGITQAVTAGNAFAEPGWVIAGDVAVMVFLFGAVIAAAFWQSARLGAALAAGAAVPMVAQLVSAFVQNAQPTSAAFFGFTPSQAAAAGLTISNGFTLVFWVYLAFLIALVAGCVVLAFLRVKPLSSGSAATVASPFPG
jgi:hypothetical protein